MHNVKAVSLTYAGPSAGGGEDGIKDWIATDPFSVYFVKHCIYTKIEMVFDSVIIENLFTNKYVKYTDSINFFGKGIKYLLDFVVLEKKTIGQKVKYKVASIDEIERWKHLMFEKKVIKKTLELVNGKDVFWDIGANIGVYSCLVLSSMETNGKIVAIEPEKKNFTSLKNNLKMNFESKRWKTLNIALSDYNGTGKLDISSEEVGSGGHTLGDKKGNKVKVRTAKRLIEKNVLDKPDVVKVDIEGNELDALRGFGEILSEVNMVICEVHNKTNNEGKFRDFGESKGFRVTKIHERPNSWDDMHILMYRD